jgi:hypothetical protein
MSGAGRLLGIGFWGEGGGLRDTFSTGETARAWLIWKSYPEKIWLQNAPPRLSGP